MTDNPEVSTETLAETGSYMAWVAKEPDGEKTFHLELGQVTVHFFDEEWEEFLTLMREVV